MDGKNTDSGDRTAFSSGALRDRNRDSRKGMYHYMSPIAIRRYAQRCEFGHLKYGDGRNWEKGMPIGEYMDSALRHIFQYVNGENGEDHLAAAMWNIACAMHTEELMPEMQDLPMRMENND